MQTHTHSWVVRASIYHCVMYPLPRVLAVSVTCQWFTSVCWHMEAERIDAIRRERCAVDCRCPHPDLTRITHFSGIAYQSICYLADWEIHGPSPTDSRSIRHARRWFLWRPNPHVNFTAAADQIATLAGVWLDAAHLYEITHSPMSWRTGGAKYKNNTKQKKYKDPKIITEMTWSWFLFREREREERFRSKPTVAWFFLGMFVPPLSLLFHIIPHPARTPWLHEGGL